MITDVSEAFELAIKKDNLYYNLSKKQILQEIEQTYTLSLDDDSNLQWYRISEHENSNGFIMFLSYKYPVAIYFNNSKHLINCLNKFNVNIILINTEYLACNPEYLSYFRTNPSIKFIDDSFFYDNDIPFDYEAYEKIESGCNYINPYKFTITDLLNM